MSSELFENFEYEFTTICQRLNRKINAQAPNYTGEQRKSCIRDAEKDIEHAEDLLQEMDMETRSAPPSYRNQLNSKLNDFRSELAKLRRDLDNLRGGGGGRDELFAGGRGGQSYQSGAADQRSRLLQGTDRLQATSDRLANAQRIGEESEAIGVGILGELDTQRDTIVRTANKVRDTDANLGKSHRILQTMSRRVMTNKALLLGIIFLLLGILGITIYLKLR